MIIRSNIPFHSINASHHSKVHSIGCCHLRNGCKLHYDTADSVLTSGCSFISQQICITIFIALAILGICIKIEKLSAGRRSMYIHISRWHTFHFRSVNYLIATRWRRWRSGRIWRQSWSQLYESLWWGCTCAVVPPACLGFLCCSIVARTAVVSLIFPKYSWVSFHCRLHIATLQKYNSPHLLFSDFGATYLDQAWRFLYWVTQKSSFGHFGLIQGKMHGRLFWLYPTSLPCHTCRHVDDLQELSSCIHISDSAINSTQYVSVALSNVVTACFVHSRGCLSQNSCLTDRELTTSWCLIPRTVPTNALVDQGGFPLWVAWNWSRSCLCTPAVCNIVSWWHVPQYDNTHMQLGAASDSSLFQF